MILKVSLSDALQNSGGRKPHRPSAYPATMTRNTGSVAFRLKIRFCIVTSFLFREKENSHSETLWEFSWCGRWDLNPHVIDTRTSNVPVCRFQHFRLLQ